MSGTGRVARLGLALTVAVGLAGPAVATVIDMPSCMLDMNTGQLVPEQAAAVPGIRALQTANVWENDFVTFSWLGDEDERVVLQHCPTGDFLLIVTRSPDPADRVFARFYEMLAAEQGYTLRQIGEAAARLGAGARIGKGEWGDCICRELGQG